MINCQHFSSLEQYYKSMKEKNTESNFNITSIGPSCGWACVRLTWPDTRSDAGWMAGTSGSVAAFKSTTTKPSWSSASSSTVLGCMEPRMLWYTDMLKMIEVFFFHQTRSKQGKAFFFSLKSSALTLDARLIDFRAVIFQRWWDRWRWNMVAVSRTMIHPLNSVLATMATNWEHHHEIQHLNYFDCVACAQRDYFLFQRMEFLLPSQFAEEYSHHLWNQNVWRKSINRLLVAAIHHRVVTKWNAK